MLIPVLDDDKHYWVGDDEVEKLLRRGEGWLAAHPERELIAAPLPQAPARRWPATRWRGWRTTTRPIPTQTREPARRGEEVRRTRLSLHEQRLQRRGWRRSGRAAQRACWTSAAARAGCCASCWRTGRSSEIVGLDVSYRALERAADRLHLDRLPSAQRQRLTLLHGSLTYRDERLAGYDAAAVVEVIEHLDSAAPGRVRAGAVRVRAARHGGADHAEPGVQRAVPHAARRAACATATTASSGRAQSSRPGRDAVAAAPSATRVRFSPIGPEDPDAGAPTQMAVFTHGGVTTTDEHA